MSPAGQRAVVVFTGRASRWWLGLLRPGFRHCFVAVNDGRAWIGLDPMAQQTRLGLSAPADFDLAGYYRALGHVVVETEVRPAPMICLPPALFTCVEAVKRVIGLRAWYFLTPRALFRKLKKNSEKQKKKP
ncbi:MAG: hypothetical protein FJX47_09020 [Alphaproteobacteria bacterium]|nr:hypothetical protein [Alphaproteobacteria bacterium]